MAEFLNALDASSTRPYLIRAMYEWCNDHGLTPYVAVLVDETVQVPREYVKNNEIVLNVSFDATSSLKLGNDFIEFKARFAGSAREIIVPVSRVIAIYARENGQGMAFPAPAVAAAGPASFGLDQDTSSDSRALVVAPPSAVENSSDAKVVQLVPDTALQNAVPDDSENTHESPEPPEPPKPTPGTRPTLKRVK